VKLADVYHVNLHWLVTGTGEMFVTSGKEGSATQFLDDAIVKLKLVRKAISEEK